MREAEGGGNDDGHVQSLEELMREAEGGGDDGVDDAPPEPAPEPVDDGHVQSLEEMMREAEGN